MIILQYSGTGFGFMSGISEYLHIYETEDDYNAKAEELAEDPDNTMTVEEAHACPGFTFDKKFDTENDIDFGGLPYERTLAVRP